MSGAPGSSGTPGAPGSPAAAGLAADARDARPRATYGGEAVILSIKPHPLYILLGSARDVVLLLLAGWLLAWMAGRGWAPFTPSRVSSLFITLALLRLGWQALDWAARQYILTDRRVVRIAGVLRRYVFESTLSSIQHTDLIRTVPERVFGLGSIGFSTAGTGVTEAYWLSVGRPEEVLRTVRDAMRKYGKH